MIWQLISIVFGAALCCDQCVIWMVYYSIENILLSKSQLVAQFKSLPVWYRYIDCESEFGGRRLHAVTMRHESSCDHGGVIRVDINTELLCLRVHRTLPWITDCAWWKHLIKREMWLSPSRNVLLRKFTVRRSTSIQIGCFCLSITSGPLKFFNSDNFFWRFGAICCPKSDEKRNGLM